MSRKSKEENGRLEKIFGASSPNWVPESDGLLPTRNDLGDLAKSAAWAAATIIAIAAIPKPDDPKPDSSTTKQ